MRAMKAVLDAPGSCGIMAELENKGTRRKMMTYSFIENEKDFCLFHRITEGDVHNPEEIDDKIITLAALVEEAQSIENKLSEEELSVFAFEVVIGAYSPAQKFLTAYDFYHDKNGGPINVLMRYAPYN